MRVVTLAAPSAIPASPKTALILGAVGFVSLALQIGAILFGELLSGRAISDRNAPAARTAHAVEPQVEAAPGPVAEGKKPAPAKPGPKREKAVLPPLVAEAEVEDDLEDTDEYLPEEEFEPEEEDEPEIAQDEEDYEDDEYADELDEEPEPVVPAPAPARAPVRAATPAPTARHNAMAASALALGNLSADIAIGRVRVVLLAALANSSDIAEVAESLVADALRKGLSVAYVDAGSGHTTSNPGISDLCADKASFGDVVHKAREGLAEVPWGQLPKLEHRSMRPITLIEALTDIYEVVIISTGRVGMTSSLPIFSGTSGRLVLVGAASTVQVEAATADAAALGFDVGQTVAIPRQYEVA